MWVEAADLASRMQMVLRLLINQQAGVPSVSIILISRDMRCALDWGDLTHFVQQVVPVE